MAKTKQSKKVLRINLGGKELTMLKGVMDRTQMNATDSVKFCIKVLDIEHKLAEKGFVVTYKKK